MIRRSDQKLKKGRAWPIPHNNAYEIQEAPVGSSNRKMLVHRFSNIKPNVTLH